MGKTWATMGSWRKGPQTAQNARAKYSTAALGSERGCGCGVKWYPIHLMKWGGKDATKFLARPTVAARIWTAEGASVKAGGGGKSGHSYIRAPLRGSQRAAAPRPHSATSWPSFTPPSPTQTPSTWTFSTWTFSK